jgi:hypothetical protein
VRGQQAGDEALQRPEQAAQGEQGKSHASLLTSEVEHRQDLRFAKRLAPQGDGDFAPYARHLR